MLLELRLGDIGLDARAELLPRVIPLFRVHEVLWYALTVLVVKRTVRLQQLWILEVVGSHCSR